jgi:transglutaminase-like putative cysteine protease
MVERTGAAWTLTAERLIWLAAALSLAVLPHVPHLPAWVSLAFAVFVLWRLAGHRRLLPLPGRPLNLLMGIGVSVGVFLGYGSLFGRNPGVAMLVALSGMKLLEARSFRDAFVSGLLGYFLVITHFLYSQSIPTGIYLFLVVVVMTGTLATLASERGDMGTRERLALAASLVLQAVPLSLILFLLFPRIAGPLWGLPADAHGTVTGLSDQMSPGNISRLGQSDAIAFRVLFEGEPPPQGARYWRGPVLWQTDGKTWGPGTPERGMPTPPTGAPVRYTVTLEPHNTSWLFLLDVPGEIPEGVRISADYVVTSQRPVHERLRYRASSVPDFRPPAISANQRRLALQLPADSHPRAKALAAAWRRQLGSPRKVVQAALAYFRKEDFHYTLRPPLLQEDPVDEFLFDSRRGFCEHYAAAFAVLMRAADIPARVVLGYQGGQVNPLDGYVVVRQRDAHAWVEVWLDDAGWVRVDPTAAVSPARIESGLDTALPQRPSALLGLELQGGTALRDLWRQLRFGWDAIDNAWNQWVLGYGPARQAGLLSRLGLDTRDWRHLGGALLLAMGSALLAVRCWLSWHSRRPREPIQAAYGRFCRKLARRRLARSPSEGPSAYGRRAMAHFPHRAAQIHRITEAYAELRYGAGQGDVRELERLVAVFRP